MNQAEFSSGEPELEALTTLLEAALLDWVRGDR